MLESLLTGQTGIIARAKRISPSEVPTDKAHLQVPIVRTLLLASTAFQVYFPAKSVRVSIERRCQFTLEWKVSRLR